MPAVRLAIHGAAGRMGQRLVALGSQDPGLKIVAALEHAKHPALEQDAGAIAGVGPVGVRLSATLDVEADAIIDFSVPEATAGILQIALEKRVALVVATTGLEAEIKQRINAAAATIPVLWSPSMSLAVNLLMKLSTLAGTALKDYPGGVDVEIIERHHRYKEDAPSGTALKFGDLIAQAMGLTEHIHGREGRIGKRKATEIGYHAVRTGDNPGEHNIVFGMLGETIELTVKASNRDCYAAGALAAAKFLAGQKPKLYGMQDVLKL